MPIKQERQERIVRKAEARRRIPVGKTKFEEDISPRLTKVQLGPRAVGYLESSVDRLIDQMVEESAKQASGSRRGRNSAKKTSSFKPAKKTSSFRKQTTIPADWKLDAAALQDAQEIAGWDASHAQQDKNRRTE
jgi:hypothetical protein